MPRTMRRRSMASISARTNAGLRGPGFITPFLAAGTGCEEPNANGTRFITGRMQSAFASKSRRVTQTIGSPHSKDYGSEPGPLKKRLSRRMAVAVLAAGNRTLSFLPLIIPTAMEPATGSNAEKDAEFTRTLKGGVSLKLGIAACVSTVISRSGSTATAHTSRGYGGLLTRCQVKFQGASEGPEPSLDLRGHRLAESKGSPKIDFEVVLIYRKPCSSTLTTAKP